MNGSKIARGFFENLHQTNLPRKETRLEKDGTSRAYTPKRNLNGSPIQTAWLWDRLTNNYVEWDPGNTPGVPHNLPV